MKLKKPIFRGFVLAKMAIFSVKANFKKSSLFSNALKNALYFNSVAIS